jgi:Family of unknown function (DUF6114)
VSADQDNTGSVGTTPTEPAPDPADGRATPPSQPGAPPSRAAAVPPSRAARAWAAWRRWRVSRPFWGGLLVTLGGLEILASMRAPLDVIIHFGARGVAGLIVPVIMLLCGLFLWFNPDQRTFYAVLAIIMALASWVTSNLGGFILGMVLGVIGGSVAFAWAPRRRRRRPRPRPAPPDERPAQPA